ncbi:MAG TPA: protein kinase [Gemmatimonadales bacterium]|nr:protein kinase [Gemmatimonadales bacterium]
MPDAPARVDPLFLSFQTALAGRYSLERELGRGGMGVVYLARDARLDRLVAIKLLPPGRALDASLRERFLREARTAAKLSHPNIVPIFAVEEIGEFVFFAMAFVDGETLTERVRARGPLPASDGARILREIAWALGYAHGQGVIHRDVKPDNILLERASGRALINDFGIAAVVRGAGSLDGGEVIGTPEFMSPEQALGEAVDPRADLYALGLVGYFALSGRLAFEAEKATEVLAKQITEAPKPLAEVADGVPRRLAQAVTACLAKDREERPADAAALAERLSLALDGRKELPVGLRVFVKRGGRLGGMGGLIYALFLPIGITMAAGLAPARAQELVAWLALGAGVFGVPAVMLVARARRLLVSGFEPQDLAAGYRAELELGRDERVFEYGGRASTYERVMRLLAAGSASIALLTGSMLTTSFPSNFAVFAYSAFATLATGFLWLTRLNRRIDLDTRIWSWIWQGPIGRSFFALARPFVGKRALAPATTHRATELALSLAAERLFAELPRATRQELKELPDVVRRLEEDAQRMRRRLDVLNDALGDVRDVGTGEEKGKRADEQLSTRHDAMVADLRAEREQVQKRLKDAVAALETIRLNLLRLHAGTGSVQSLTTDLGLAREVAREVDLLFQSNAEAEEGIG